MSSSTARLFGEPGGRVPLVVPTGVVRIKTGLKTAASVDGVILLRSVIYIYFLATSVRDERFS